MKTVHELQEIAIQVRRDILRMTHKSSSGHPGGSLGCADFLTSLFFNFLKINPENFKMDGLNEDIFILSNGHISPVLYSVMARKGYFPLNELSTFRFIGTRLQGHPTPSEGLPGIRIATGSLGQGLSVAIGTALSKKLNSDQNLVYCLMGDGELQEGQNWEAFMFSAHHKVDNLIAIVDYNNKQIDGNVDQVMSLGSIYDKINSFGWQTIEMNGNDIADILKNLELSISRTGNKMPVCIIMKTIMGKGVDFMENDHTWHGSAPDDKQLVIALSQLTETIGDY